jgi:hypothetical protein
MMVRCPRDDGERWHGKFMVTLSKRSPATDNLHFPQATPEDWVSYPPP